MKQVPNKRCFRDVRLGILDLFRISIFEFRTSALPAQGGQAITLAAIFFLIISLTVGLGVARPVMNGLESVRAIQASAESLYGAQGVSEDVLYRLMHGQLVDTVETLSFGSVTATATTTSVSDGLEITATGDRSGFVRRSKAHLTTGGGAVFNYGVQIGEGGIILNNSSSIVGNVYSNGFVQGGEGTEDKVIQGDVVSAGTFGLIEKIHATSSAYARTIKNSTIDKDAYYEIILDTTVLGTLHPGSTDQATSSLPVTDTKIEEWKENAESGGVISSPCPYIISGTATFGPKKIACDMEIRGNNYTLTLAGDVWVAGNITVSNGPTLQIASSLDRKSIALIADNPSNRTTSSKITSVNSAQFRGSGTAGSYILLVSQNTSAENGGSEVAIQAGNSTKGDLVLYAGHGEISISNSVSLKEVTAYKLSLWNTAKVIYETGLANLLFSGGPGGGYVFDRWREVE